MDHWDRPSVKENSGEESPDRKNIPVTMPSSPEIEDTLTSSFEESLDEEWTVG
jgi:hypothetical protein